jgi:hypothetical protein
VDADAEFDAAFRRQAGVALDQAVLHFDSAAHGVDDTPELDETAIAGALEDTAVVHSDGRINEIAAQRPEPGQRPVLVGPGEPAVADHIGGQDRRDLSGLAQWRAPLPLCRLAQRPGKRPSNSIWFDSGDEESAPKLLADRPLWVELRRLTAHRMSGFASCCPKAARPLSAKSRLRLWQECAPYCHSAALACFLKADITSARAFDHHEVNSGRGLGDEVGVERLPGVNAAGADGIRAPFAIGLGLR